MAVHELFTLVEQSDVDGLPAALAAKALQTDFDTLEGRVDGHDTDLSNKADESHTHDASDVSTGTLDIARLPPVMWATSTNTTTQVGSFTIDLAGITYPFRVKVIQNHDAGIVLPSTGMYDGQVIKVLAFANGGARQFVFSGLIIGSTGLPSMAFSIPDGEVLIGAVEYSQDADTWVLTAATVSAA